MNAARRYLLYSTAAGIFGSSLVYNGAVNIQAFYLLMLVNLFLIMLMQRLWIPIGVVALVAFLVVSGALGILRDTDTLARVAKEFIGITMSATYFCCFFRAMNFDMELCATLYARFAYWVAIIGFIMYLPFLILFRQYRLHSVLHEPSMFAITCLPALYFYADRWFKERTYGRELLVMAFAMLLCQSSTGFIGVLTGVCIFGFRFKRARLLVPFAVAITGTILYFSSADFALRVSDTASIFETEDVANVNLSTYALYSNIYVMEQVISFHPIMGNGLGSHGMSYERYISGLQGLESYTENIAFGLNAEDANSLATRVLSEMGIFGLVVILWFIWHFRPRGSTAVDALCKGILVYFVVSLLRNGNYLSNEEWFFILFYALHRTTKLRDRSSLEWKTYHHARQTLIQT